VSTDSEGHLQLLRWARQFEEVEFALEDCRHLTRRLEGDLLAAGQRVIRVPTRLMADARRAGRERGKSDPIDAEAVAWRRCGILIFRSHHWTDRRER
jgi:transposase